MKINNGDKVRVTNMANAFAKFMNVNVGDEFIVEAIDARHNVHLVSVDDKKHLTFSANLLDKYFEKVEDEFFYDIDDDDFDYIAEIFSESNFVVTNAFNKCTIVACQLPNGFVIVESSSCVDPDNYDEEVGIENCLNKIKDKVIELEAYLYHEECSCHEYDECDNEDDDEDEDCDCEDCPHCGECGK